MLEFNNQGLNDNLERCPSFIRCNKNLCPLDFELSERTGGKSERCKYMRDPREVVIKGKEIISGGTVMPDELLKFVPKSNLNWLNIVSKQRWQEIMAQNGVKPLYL